MAAKAGASDEAVAEKTGRTLAEWFKLLDKWGARERPHKEIAAYLADERGVDAWWAQSLTVAYERARGLRDVGQRADGHYEASVTRTLAAAPGVVEHALLGSGGAIDQALAAEPRIASTRQGRVLRYAAADERVQVVVTPLPDGRSRVNVTQGNLSNAQAREDAKARWAAALEDLKARVGAA